MCWSLCVEEGAKSLHSLQGYKPCVSLQSPLVSPLWALELDIDIRGPYFLLCQHVSPVLKTRKTIYCWLIHSFFEGSSQCQGLRQIAAKAHWHRSYRALGRALQSTCYSKKTTQRSSPDVKPKPMNISGIRNKRRCGALQLPHK